MKRTALLFLVLAACKTTDSTPKADPAPTPPDRAPVARTAPALPPGRPEGSAAAAPTDPRPHVPMDRPWMNRGERMAKLDTDGDGKISDEERAAGMKARAENIRQRMDANGDGKLTVDELANAQGRMKFDNPAAIDTNKDGEISTDELAAAMKARRDAARAQQGEAPASPTP